MIFPKNEKYFYKKFSAVLLKHIFILIYLAKMCIVYFLVSDVTT